MGFIDSIFGNRAKKAKSKFVMAARRIEGKMHLFEISRNRAGHGSAVIKQRESRTGEKYHRELGKKS